MSILDEADGTINRKAMITDGTKEDIERIAVIISENYHFRDNVCFIDIDADNIEDAAIKYNSLENDFNYVTNNLNQIMQLIYKGYTFRQIKENNMIDDKSLISKKAPKTSKAQLEAVAKYQKSRAEIRLRVSQEIKSMADANAKYKGLSLTAYISQLIEADTRERVEQDFEQWKEVRQLEEDNDITEPITLTALDVDTRDFDNIADAIAEADRISKEAYGI